MNVMRKCEKCFKERREEEGELVMVRWIGVHRSEGAGSRIPFVVGCSHEKKTPAIPAKPQIQIH